MSVTSKIKSPIKYVLDFCTDDSSGVVYTDNDVTYFYNLTKLLLKGYDIAGNNIKPFIQNLNSIYLYYASEKYTIGFYCKDNSEDTYVFIYERTTTDASPTNPDNIQFVFCEKIYDKISSDKYTKNNNPPYLENYISSIYTLAGKIQQKDDTINSLIQRYINSVKTSSLESDDTSSTSTGEDHNETTKKASDESREVTSADNINSLKSLTETVATVENDQQDQQESAKGGTKPKSKSIKKRIHIKPKNNSKKSRSK